MASYAELLTEVPNAAALQAARHHGALLARRGTCGEDGHAWLFRGGRWLHDDGYNRTAVDEAQVPDDGLEVIDWPGATNRAAMDATLDQLEQVEYEAIATLAASSGDEEDFLAAVDSVHILGLCSVDESLYERLTATRDEVAELDEDCGRLPER